VMPMNMLLLSPGGSPGGSIVSWFPMMEMRR